MTTPADDQSTHSLTMTGVKYVPPCTKEGTLARMEGKQELIVDNLKRHDEEITNIEATLTSAINELNKVVERFNTTLQNMPTAKDYSELRTQIETMEAKQTTSKYFFGGIAAAIGAVISYIIQILY